MPKSNKNIADLLPVPLPDFTQAINFLELNVNESLVDYYRDQISNGNQSLPDIPKLMVDVQNQVEFLDKLSIMIMKEKKKLKSGKKTNFTNIEKTIKAKR
ncbi:MAG: hypothetical protein GX638_01330, partial [Crenarchaeota archaeon]|nr:hypothetical protein [Thermoproteota archaeon]